jgi:5'-3' exonuclease
MGILNFHKWLKDNYSECFKSCWKQSYDHVYIDLNYALHCCSYNVKTTDEIYDKLFIFIEQVCNETKPNKSITLANDGVAPLSKLLLQRKRRLEKSTNENEKDITTISSLMFSPGTQFMDNLKDNMNNFINYIKFIYKIDIILNLETFDEAEIKLKRHIQTTLLEYPNDSFIITTNDSDVVLLLMTLNNVNNIYMYEKKHMNSEIISIGQLLLSHINNVGCSLQPNLDFTAVNMFMGNDYFPKLENLTFEKLWDAYKFTLKRYHNGLTYNNISIDKQFIISMLSYIVYNTKNSYCKKITVDNISNLTYKNYIDGYIWCLTTYYNGKCDRYDYIYNYKTLPNIYGLILNIIKLNLFDNIETNYNFDLINSHLYGILILPNKCKSLIDPKYHNFMDNCKKLYELENCTECIKLHNNINNNIDVLNNKKILLKHKKTHVDIKYNDIIKIINKFNKLF